MRFLETLYRTISFLSLDVVAGAVCSSFFLAKLYNTSLVPNGAPVLALTVWIIYSADHLLDAVRMEGKASTGRHIFHRRYFRLILVGVIAAVFVEIILIYGLPKFVVVRGVIAGIVVAAYLAAQKKLYFVKEAVAGVLYCTGVLIPLEVPLEKIMLGMPALITFQFFCVVLMNLLLFSWFDLDKDVRQRTLSAVAIMGRSRARWVIIALFGVELLIALYTRFQMPALIVLVMGAMHLIIMAFDRFFQSRERYRAVADGIFILPVLYLLQEVLFRT